MVPQTGQGNMETLNEEKEQELHELVGQIEEYGHRNQD